MPDAAAILDFWFGSDALSADEHEALAARWFRRDDAFDAAIRSRFGGLVEAARAGELDGWSTAPASWLALLLLLDQFPRNLYRNTAAAFASDAKAQQSALDGIARGHDQALAVRYRAFAYLPLEHAEDLALQQRCVRLFETLAADPQARPAAAYLSYLDYARRHCEVIGRYGRFPHRNHALGRASTPEEQAYLDAGGGF
ncbi:MAG: hypothetical protein BGP24_20900 [Lysobacterales bacterium 69-70]|nr:DUF924 domain-containing protein [Xanthomonadaceae bacterium]ODU35947.1 MAG: hypothetical protein ABS97_03695 [Xanthomonadaceae bacterium SCN 69-320]ODV18434.1 MAG: hypothetical protein ABT27_14345 [Xanthomonadaceae bacterium SCN 69-25]OJY97415.1 MAG: hypothetical protein BGP24_20900 [Xanthomonadales bacterium 69-70]